jgi:hypothetical protein
MAFQESCWRHRDRVSPPDRGTRPSTVQTLLHHMAGACGMYGRVDGRALILFSKQNVINSSDSWVPNPSLIRIRGFPFARSRIRGSKTSRIQ